MQGDLGNNIPLNSAHPGGCNTVFTVGVVKLLSESVPLDTLHLMARRNDGQVSGE